MFDLFRKRMGCSSEQEAILKKSVDISEQQFCNSIYYKRVIINGEYHDARMTESSGFASKGSVGNYYLQFREGYKPQLGSYVYIENAEGKYKPWLLLRRSEMRPFGSHFISRCNYLLRWKNKAGKIIERWCVLDDTTSLGARVSTTEETVIPINTLNLTLPYDEETREIQRDQRFLIDDEEYGDVPNAFQVINHRIVANSKSEEDGDKTGTVLLSMKAHNFNATVDNKELMVADYKTAPDDTSDSKVYKDYKINFTGKPVLYMGAPEKKFTFTSDNDIAATWTIKTLDKFAGNFKTRADRNSFYVKATLDKLMIDSYITIYAMDGDTVLSELRVKVVSSV